MLCPICGPYLITRRIRPIKAEAERLQADGGLLHFLLTLSVRHGASTPWGAAAMALGDMRRAIRRLRSWRKGVVGSFRVLESTYGPSGHHLHEHVLVSVRPPEGWSDERFRDEVEAACQRAARLSGLTCAFRPGWWLPIPAHELARTVSYFACRKKWGPVDGSNDDGHAPVWEMPAEAFAEVWRESKGVRWFDASGCWKVKNQAEESNSDIPEVVEGAETVVLHFPAVVWTSWSPAERRKRLALICDARVPLPALMEMALDWGARMGPPEAPTTPSCLIADPTPKSPS